MRKALITVAILLTGCAHHDFSQQQSDQMGVALKQAVQPCFNRGNNPFNTVEKQADCLASRERAVWVSYDPDTVDLFDIYARKRSEAAISADKKLITQQQLTDKLLAASRYFTEQVRSRRQAIVNYDASENARISAVASDVGQIFGAILIGAAVGASAAQAPQSTGIVSTSTTCQSMSNIVQCNSLSW